MGKKNELFVTIKTSEGPIHGDLILPEKARAVVLFAHGSGSSRLSPRNKYVAEFLNQKRFGTFLVDLLTLEEEQEDRLDGSFRFDISLLTRRLAEATAWFVHQYPGKGFKIGYFGASTGAAAALAAAPQFQEVVGAVVSRGGRPDLADSDLPEVRVPVLLIVGGKDPEVLELNKKALARIGSREKKMEIIPGATHLFEEPGKLDAVAVLASEWFTRYLLPAKKRRERDYAA